MIGLRIFVCYRVAPNVDVESVLPWLNKMIEDIRFLGVDVLIDAHDSTYSDSAVLQQELARCMAVIVIQTPESLVSEHVRDVVNIARELLTEARLQNVVRLIPPSSHVYDVPWEWMRLRAVDLGSGYAAVRKNLLLALGFSPDSWANTQPSRSVSAVLPAQAPATPQLVLSGNPAKADTPPKPSGVNLNTKIYVPRDSLAKIEDISTAITYVPLDVSSDVPAKAEDSATEITYVPPETPVSIEDSATLTVVNANSYVPPTLSVADASAKTYAFPSLTPSIPAVVRQEKPRPITAYVMLMAFVVLIIVFSVIAALFVHQVQANANVSATATAGTIANVAKMQQQGTATAYGHITATAAAQAAAAAATQAQATAAAQAHAKATVAAVATTQAYQASDYEAEAANNSIYGGARVKQCDGCSGGMSVGFVGHGGVVQFNGVTVPTTGNYRLVIYYETSQGRDALISVNGATVAMLHFNSTGSFNRSRAEVITVPLHAGANSIAFFNDNNWAPDFDRIVV